MENETMTPREAWERHLRGEETATGSRAGYETARDTLLHNAVMLRREPCLVKSEISGWRDNPWWVRVTMTDGELSDSAQTILRAIRDDAHRTDITHNPDGTVTVGFFYHLLEG